MVVGYERLIIQLSKDVEKMDEQEHRDFLLEVAEKVSMWIIDEVIMKRFKEQAKVFYDDVEKWDEKEQISNPLGRLVLPYATVSDAHIGLLVGDDYPKHKSIQYEKEKSLQADYVMLIIIHDKRLKNPRTPLISNGIWSEDEEWVELKWKEISRGSACGSGDIQTQVELALERVEKDLTDNSPGTEQDNIQNKGKVKKIIGRVFKKTSHLIITIIIAIIGGLIVVILVDIFNDFGWLERSKTFIYNVLRLK